MSDIELVIKIPERIYYGVEKGITVNGSKASQILIDAVANGTPLPKGHGRIGDLPSVKPKDGFEEVAEDIDKMEEDIDLACESLEEDDDCISRSEAIRIASGYCHWSRIPEELAKLPSVKPKFTDEEIQTMQDLEQAEIEKAYKLGKAEGQESEDAISR